MAGLAALPHRPSSEIVLSGCRSLHSLRENRRFAPPSYIISPTFNCGI